jgi:hypothetical protein
LVSSSFSSSIKSEALLINDETLWNKTDGSPKIKLFKEHFGDEFNIKSVELKELLGGLTR